MAEPTPPETARLIVGMLSSFPELFDAASSIIAERHGDVDLTSEILPFDFTDYYTPQMGTALQRKFISFRPPYDPVKLVETKLWTNALEKRLAKSNTSVPRPINLDPGYLTLSKLVLASTKDHAHRLYLHSGIYAEITLTYVNKQFRPMPWAYADYRTEKYLDFFYAVRETLTTQG